MKKQITMIFDVVTGVTIEREMTDEEHASYLELQANIQPIVVVHDDAK